MTPSLDDRQLFDAQGFLHARQFLAHESYEEVLATLLGLLCKYAPERFADLDARSLLDDHRFHARLIEFRAETPKLFGIVYDCMQISVGLHAFAHQRELVNAAAFLVGDQPHGLMSHSHVLRLDPPRDKRNLLDWHYDYFLNDPAHPNVGGIGTWMPLQQLTAETGGLEILVGSHRTTFEQQAAPTKRGDDYTSEVFDIPQSYIDAHDKHVVEATIGDVIFFPMRLVHRGIANTSNRVRLTCLSRYYRFAADDFLPGRKPFQLVGD